MAGAVRGIDESDTVINICASGSGAVVAPIKEAGACDFSALDDAIKKIAFKITRVGRLAVAEAALRLVVNYGIIDLSPAPALTQGSRRVLI